MAIAFDSSTYGASGAGDGTLTYSHTTSGSDRILFVYITINNASTVSVTYAGNAMTSIQINSASFSHYQSLWYIIAPTTGANNVVVTATSATIRAYAASYTGASQTGQPDASIVPAEATTTSYATALTTVADNCWIVWGLCAMSGAALTAGTHTTVRHQPEVTAFGAAFCDSGDLFTPAGSSTLTVTSSSQLFCSIMASFSPAGPTTSIKTINGLAIASVKTVNGLSTASVKTVNGLA